jgi:hypothetical protein
MNDTKHTPGPTMERDEPILRTVLNMRVDPCRHNRIRNDEEFLGMRVLTCRDCGMEWAEAIK